MLYLMRHGRTDWNNELKLQGRADIPLNEEGRVMARSAAVEYKDVDFDICYCSPLVRAKETAQILLDGRDVPIIYDDRLREMSFGIYEGVVNGYHDPEIPVSVLFDSPEKYIAVPEGESLEQLFERTGEFLREVALPQVAAGKKILIVGHGAMNSSILCQMRNLPLEKFWSVGIENCKLIEV